MKIKNSVAVGSDSVRRFLSSDVLVFLSPCRMHFEMWVSKLFSFFGSVISSFFHSAQKREIIWVNTPFISYHHQFSSIGTQNSLDGSIIWRTSCANRLRKETVLCWKRISQFFQLFARASMKKVKSKKKKLFRWAWLGRKKEKRQTSRDCGAGG